MRSALMQAREGRLYILEKMYSAMPEPRKEVSPYAPKIEIITIPEEKAWIVIGPGGKNVREWREKLGVSVWVHEGGRTSLTSMDREAIEKVKAIIMKLVEDVEVGKVYEGKIVRVEPYGVFVEIMEGKTGMLHVSKMAEKVKDVRARFKVGDTIKVKVLDIDERGRPNLTTIGIDQPA
jgi:polyribonucleotide nucleotidyltransferase